jgi:hypothetical protein
MTDTGCQTIHDLRHTVRIASGLSPESRAVREDADQRLQEASQRFDKAFDRALTVQFRREASNGFLGASL